MIIYSKTVLRFPNVDLAFAICIVIRNIASAVIIFLRYLQTLQFIQNYSVLLDIASSLNLSYKSMTCFINSAINQ